MACYNGFLMYVKIVTSLTQLGHQTQVKSGRRTLADISQTHTNGPQVQKRLHISNEQGNANQKHHDAPLTHSRMAAMERTPENGKCWEGCGEGGTLTHGWWDVKRYSHCGKQNGGSAENLNNRMTTP